MKPLSVCYSCRLTNKIRFVYSWFRVNNTDEIVQRMNGDFGCYEISLLETKSSIVDSFWRDS